MSDKSASRAGKKQTAKHVSKKAKAAQDRADRRIARSHGSLGDF